jgi:hypothetical protein
LGNRLDTIIEGEVLTVIMMGSCFILWLHMNYHFALKMINFEKRKEVAKLASLFSGYIPQVKECLFDH